MCTLDMRSAAFLCCLLLVLLPPFKGQVAISVLDDLIKSQFFEASYQSVEVDWRSKSQRYMCISKCVYKTLMPTTPRPKFIERVFAPSRRLINCYTSTRKITNNCNRSVNTLPLQQLGQLPMFYFSTFHQKSRFAAEKFCSRHGMILGMPQDEMSSLLDLLPAKQTVYRKFWMQKISYAKTLAGNTTNCFFGNRKETDVLAESCKEELNFVCSLPAMCHQDACQVKCSGSSSLYCKASFPEDVRLCFPQCTSVDCSEQDGRNIGFESGEGEMIESCDRRHFISRKFFMTAASASKYCCEKRMVLTSLETRSELKCLSNKIQKLKNFGTEMKFWTSASSENCPREFGWCGSSELMDYEGLNINRERVDASKLCLTANLDMSTSTLGLKEDECTNNKARAICEAPHHYMCQRSECWKFKCPKERKDMDYAKAASI